MASASSTHKRPLGAKLLALLFLIYALGSAQVVAVLYPEWTASLHRNELGNEAFLWVEALTAISAFAAAIGLWRGKRWTRVPVVICALTAIATSLFITAFGVAAYALGAGWIVIGAAAVVFLAIAAWVIRYVWRHT